MLDEARALPLTEVSARDRVNHRLFVDALEARIAVDEACEFFTWSVSARSGPLGGLNTLGDLHEARTPQDAANLVARVEAVGSRAEAMAENLRSGLAAGRVANAEAVRRAEEMIRRQLDQPPESWPVMRVPEAIEDATARDALTGSLRDALAEHAIPGLERYANVLRDEVLPAARDDAHAGLAALPAGDACYRALIREYTTTERTPQEIHELGLAEMKRINAEMVTIGKRVFGTRKLASTVEKLRTDPALYFDTPEAVETFARDALADARAAMPAFFGVLPRADCVVRPIPDYEAPYTTIAYYQPPHADGSKPGEYFVNTFAPETRPRYEARVLAYHESIPGHHLQSAIAQELDAMPAFRKHEGQTVFVEGWGLYTERLSDEMGLYEDDLDRMGMLSFDAWRAGRLVVDTGIHALGWSRADAVRYLIEHTALAANNVDNEVDRYITTPGQALAYKIGQLELLALRADARARLGDAFDIKAFHDVVLTGGAVSIPVLRERVEAWVEGSE
jgi:uncharacterized protein (DUF885 family)